MGDIIAWTAEESGCDRDGLALTGCGCVRGAVTECESWAGEGEAFALLS